ncbi:hypothetical protein DOT_0525 [Desulfosporosinus sp. OT]|nr:hypothetical protein DOT_0525 [Desulfosporosinus sp. OT]
MINIIVFGLLILLESLCHSIKMLLFHSDIFSELFYGDNITDH